MALAALLVAGFWAIQSLFGPFVSGAGTPVLVVAAPWGPGAARLVERGGGHLVGPGQALFGAIATFDDPDPRARLHGLGAWLVRDGTFLAAFCGVGQT